jgi:ATP-dependent Clp protease ATP-binding subunit ClpA
VFERFTERARNVVVFAQDEARMLKHNYIGTEHLLLGLLREEEGLAARVLDGMGVQLQDIRVEVGRIVGQGDDVTSGQIPFTPRSKKVLELSLREAKALGHNYIGTEHVLLGLARENRGVASQILLDRGVGSETIRNEVIRMLSAPGRRQHVSKALEVELFEPQSPPLAPEVLAELARLKREKDDALRRQDFEQAARVRARERRLIDAARQLMRAWDEKNDLT